MRQIRSRVLRYLRKTGKLTDPELGDKGFSGEVVKVVEHAVKRVVGRYEASRGQAHVVPFDRRLFQDVQAMVSDDAISVSSGDMVVLKITRTATANRPAAVDRHPDHVAAALLAQRAAYVAGLRQFRPDLGPPFRPARVLAYPQRQEIVADVVVDVTAAYDRKLAAIRCHASQLAGAATPLTQAVALDVFAVRDRYWGATIGVAFGEPYQLGAPVPIADPVAHFAAHPAAPVLAVRR